MLLYTHYAYNIYITPCAILYAWVFISLQILRAMRICVPCVYAWFAYTCFAHPCARVYSAHHILISCVIRTLQWNPYHTPACLRTCAPLCALITFAPLRACAILAYRAQQRSHHAIRLHRGEKGRGRSGELYLRSTSDDTILYDLYFFANNNSLPNIAAYQHGHKK